MALNLAVGAFTFLAVLLFGVWAVQGAGRPVDFRIRSLSLSRQRGEGIAGLPFQQRVLHPIIDGIGARVTRVLPGAYVGRTDRRLTLAGRPLELSSYYALIFVFAAGLGLAYYLAIFAATSGSPHPVLLVPGIFVVLLGAYLPNFWLSSQARGRQNAMLRGLPDTMDLLTICVEAGLGLDAAFHRVAEKQSGPLVDEIRQMLREIGLGKTRREAMLDLADRTQIEDVRVFANAVIQAEQLGTSIAQVLRAQSQRLRVRRRQRAEQEARRVPVKMVFPLVFCMMPSLFIFILGPIIINIINFVSGD